MSNKPAPQGDFRVIGRLLARELTEEQLAAVAGGSASYTETQKNTDCDPDAQ